MIKLVSAAALALAALALAPAHADDVSRTVPYADLDLTTPDGRETLEKRLGAAISSICSTRGTVDLATTMRGQRCRRAAAARAASDAQVAIMRFRTRLALRGL